MRIRYKLAIAILLVSAVSSTAVILLYEYFNHHSHIEVVENEISNNLEFLSSQIEDNLYDLILLTNTLVTTSAISEQLVTSNLEYDALSQLDRDSQILDLNTEWMSTDNLNYPLIFDRMNNEVADYLNLQQENSPELFGEIFLTNKYGVMISTTGKLTTLAHSEKYWWEGSYNEGEGLIFLDDRGYDSSVEGYVLGVVVPIYDDNDEIIGILKANYNILEILNKKVANIENVNNDGYYQIVRTLGLVITKKDTVPLSESVDDKLLPFLLENEETVNIVTLDSEEVFVGIAPITLTFGTDEVQFGGSYESVDHVGGNLGEGWSIVYIITDEEAFKIIHSVFESLIYSSLLMVVILSIVSLGLGFYLTKPIIVLNNFIEEVSKGDISKRLVRTTGDEAGDLTDSFNNLLENLEKTIVTKDILEKEIVKKQKLEKKLIEISQIDELTGIYNRRAFNEFLNKYYEKAIRYEEPLAVLIFDIDDFKDINDNHGHLIGDKVLIKLTKSVSKTIRQSDIFARWGGEEFILLLPNIAEKQAFEFSERMREKIAKLKFDFDNNVTISVGVSMLKGKLSKDNLVTNADKAMYQAKSEGKNKTVVFQKK